MKRLATITPEECLPCREHIWTWCEAEDSGEWVICRCCGLQHRLQDGERLSGDDVIYSSEWLGAAR